MFETEIQNDKHIDSVQSDQVCETVHIPLSLKSETVTESAVASSSLCHWTGGSSCELQYESAYRFKNNYQSGRLRDRLHFLSGNVCGAQTNGQRVHFFSEKKRGRKGGGRRGKKVNRDHWLCETGTEGLAKFDLEEASDC